MNHEVNKKSQQGFTLIELMLAMSFIAVLLLTIAMTIIQAGAVYSKGMAVKDMNQLSRSVTSDITRTASEAKSLTLATDLRTNSAGGRLCFGSYTYIWNTVRALENNDPNLNKYQTASKGDIRLVKVPDAEKIYCELRSGGTGALLHPEVRAIDSDSSQELLAGGDHKIGLNQFMIPATAVVSDGSIAQSIYTLNFTLASGRTSAMTTDGLSCLAPNETNADPIYCNVQQFSIILKTGNRG